MVKLSLSLPALRNSIPILSTSPFSHDLPAAALLDPDHPAISNHLSCSNLNLQDGNSLLRKTLLRGGTPGGGTPGGGTPSGGIPGSLHFHFDSIYSHLNRSGCRWEFSAWYPLRSFLRTCHGWTNTTTTLKRGEGEEVVVTTSISVYSTGVHFGTEGVSYTARTGESTIVRRRRTVLPHTSSSFRFLPPSLHILPENSPRHTLLPFLFPVSVVTEGNGDVCVYLSSVAPANQLFLPSNGSHDIDLLHADKSRSTQSWLLHLSQGFHYPPLIQFTSTSSSSTKVMRCEGCDKDHFYLFNLPIEVPGVSGEVPTLRLDVSANLLSHELMTGGGA